MSTNIVRSDVVETNAKSWPLTAVAMLFVLEGFVAGYAALQLATFGNGPQTWGESEALFGYAIASVALIVAGVGILLRVRACLTIGVIVTGLYLAWAGASAIEAFFVPATVWEIVARCAFIITFCLQYAVLRNRSTVSLFGRS